MLGNKEVPLGPFPSGVDNVSKETNLAPDALRGAENVDISNTGTLALRPGYIKRLTLTDSHSLYSNGSLALVVDDGYLKRLWVDSFTLASLAPVTGYVSYADVLGTVYYTDGSSTGRITPEGVREDAWVVSPAGRPTLSNATGSLDAGRYQVAITYINSALEESGASIADAVDVTTGGIALTNIPQSSDADYIRVYLTTTNGTKLLSQINLVMGTTSHTLKQHNGGRELETQFAESMPAGHVLCHHYGRNYVAVDNTVFYSLPLRPGLTRLHTCWFPQFKSRVKLIMSHTSGLFVVADKTYFLAGGNPGEMVVREASPHSAVEASGAYLPASVLKLEVPGVVPFWLADNGFVAGVEGGLYNLTENQLAVSTYGRGATILKEVEGVRTIISGVQSVGQANGFAASDSVEMTIRRGGIEI